jgi:hypothetical protein
MIMRTPSSALPNIVMAIIPHPKAFITDPPILLSALSRSHTVIAAAVEIVAASSGAGRVTSAGIG